MMSTPSQNQTDSFEQKVQVLSQIACLRIDELVDALGIRLSKGRNKLVGCCPIHGGDNHGAINLYPDGHTVPGYWRCQTHFCEKVFKKTIVGFVRGVLSNQKYGWGKDGDKTVSFVETVEWLCKFVGQNLDEIKVDVAELERRKFVSSVTYLNKGVDKKEQGIPKNMVKANLEIPAQFFVDRGYSPHILSAYDVGLCTKQGKEMSNRVVVPIYNKERMMIGCTGRSVHKQCTLCKAYHFSDLPCPRAEDRWLFSKWKHSKDFNTSSHLYNYWDAIKCIHETGVAILVEGPADLWKLEECDIHNAVAIFGCELSDEQQVLLEKSGAMSIILLLDNDEAGREATKNITKILSRSYDIHTFNLKVKDVGEMSCEDIRNEIVPKVKQIQAKRQPLLF